MLHTLAEGTSWRTPKKKMVFDDAASTHTTDSSKTTMGGFVSMFAKRSQTKLHQIPVAFNVDPKPSKSTPISSPSRPTKTWLPLSGMFYIYQYYSTDIYTSYQAQKRRDIPLNMPSKSL